MKTYQIKGFIIPKGAEDQGWKTIGEDTGITLPNNINPYEAISNNFKLIASYWLFTIKEIEKTKE